MLGLCGKLAILLDLVGRAGERRPGDIVVEHDPVAARGVVPRDPRRIDAVVSASEGHVLVMLIDQHALELV